METPFQIHKNQPLKKIVWRNDLYDKHSWRKVVNSGVCGIMIEDCELKGRSVDFEKQDMS